jgi:hypothetical protein
MGFLFAFFFWDLTAEDVFERVREKYRAIEDGFYVAVEVARGDLRSRRRFTLSGAQAGCRHYDCKSVVDGFETYLSPEEACEYHRRTYEWDCAPTGRTNLQRLYADSLGRLEALDWDVVERVAMSRKRGHWVLRYGYRADPDVRQTLWVRESDFLVTRIERESRKEMVEVVFRRTELGTKPALESFRFAPPKGARRVRFLRR